MTAINVIPAARVFARRRRRRVTLWAWGCGVYGTAIALSIAATSIARHADHSAISARLLAAREANDAQRNEIASMAGRISVARRMIAVHEEVARQPDFSVLLRAIASFLSSETTLTRLSLTPVLQAPAVPPASEGKSASSTRATAAPVLIAYRVEIAGLGRTLGDINDFVLRLEASGLFDRVELLGTQREVRGAQEIAAFQLRATLGEKERR